jgi:glycosyltransferase involved in cell wall biosynthesis
MYDLSIILDGDKKEILNHLKILEPLIINYDTELIINNSKDSFNIPYEHSILNFSNSYNNFIEYFHVSSQSKRIMIIKKGIKLDPVIISPLCNAIDLDDYHNISVYLNTYLTKDKSTSFKREEVILYHRGVKGFNNTINIILEDRSLINLNNIDIKNNIQVLVKGHYYNELLKWYKYLILSMKIDFINNFHIILEEYKSKLENNIIKDIETPFINCDINNEYTYYIHLKNNIYLSAINIKYKNLSEEELYYSWLMKNFFVNNKIPSFFIHLPCNLQYSLLSYLLNNDNSIELSIYNMIMDNINKKRLNTLSNLESYLYIAKNYMKYLSNKSATFELKEKLLSIFDIYMYYSKIYYKQTNEISIELEFIYLFETAINLIKENLIEKAINSLEKLSKIYTDKVKIIYNYIQKLRDDYEIYSYTLSICMIVKDEEKNIDRCLRSIKSLIDSKIAEIIIVDTGSKDNTLEIAKKYTNNIYHFKWTGNFSDARNYSNLFASGKYIFTLDADEEFSLDELNKLIIEFSNQNTKYNTYTLQIISYSNTELTQFSGITQARIFKNNTQFYYENSVHNQPTIIKPIKHLDIKILHYGYIMTEDIKEKKFIRTSTLLKKELEKDPRNVYYRYQLSTSYSMYGDISNAIKQVDIFIRIINENKVINDITLMYFNNAAAIYLNNKRYVDAEKVVDLALNYKGDYIDFIYYKANILFVKGYYDEALIYINKYLANVDNYFNLDIAKDGKYVFYTLGYHDKMLQYLIYSNYRLKNYNLCIDNAYKFKNDIYLKNCLHELIDSYFYTCNFEKLVDFYNIKIKSSSLNCIEDILMYFLLDNLFKLPTKDLDTCLSYFKKNLDNVLIKNLTNKIKTNTLHTQDETINLIKNYPVETMDFISLKEIVLNIKYIFNEPIDNLTINEILKIKIAAQTILVNSNKLLTNKTLTHKNIIDVFDKYITVGAKLLEQDKLDMCENHEGIFITKVIYSLNQKVENIRYSINNLNRALIYYPEMKEIIKIIISSMHKNINSHLYKKVLPKQSIIKPNLNKINMHDNPMIKVLHGTMDATERTKNIVNIINKSSKFINAEALNYTPNYILHNSNYQYDIYKFLKNKEKLQKDSLSIASEILSKFDIFNFHSFSSLTLDHSDLVKLKELQKIVFMHFWGNDIRISSKAVKYNPYIKINKNNDDLIIRTLDNISNYISHCIISNLELLDYAKNFFDNITFIKPMIDINKYHQINTNKVNSKFTIVHTYGTNIDDAKSIIKIMQELKNNYNFDFYTIQEMSYENTLKIYSLADLVIDQISLGYYTMNSIKAMALEKTVICFISDFMKEKYPKDNPILVANINNLKEKIEFILKNKDLLISTGIKGRKYVEKHHNSNIEILPLIDLYKKIIKKSD